MFVPWRVNRFQSFAQTHIFRTHRIHVWYIYIFTIIYLHLVDFMVNVGQ